MPRENPAQVTGGSGNSTGTGTLSVSRLPIGAKASFYPSSVSGTGTSGLTVSTTSATPKKPTL